MTRTAEDWPADATSLGAVPTCGDARRSFAFGGGEEGESAADGTISHPPSSSDVDAVEGAIGATSKV